MQGVAQLGWAGLALLCCVAALGCGSEPDPDPQFVELDPSDIEDFKPPEVEVEIAPRDVETQCSWTVSDENGENVERRGNFFMERMNEKLLAHPELRELVSFDRVSSCDEAKAFLEQYQAYSITHPDFDATPVPEPAEGLPIEEDTPTGDAEKISQGQSAVNFPVVELIRKVPGLAKPRLCSGFFISRHHIATAQHCTWADRTWGQFAVTWKNNFGSYRSLKYAGSSSDYVWLYMYRYPNWLGAADPNLSDAPNDFAILYVDPKIHGQLPATSKPTPETTTSAMRISRATALTVGTRLGIWGWGFRINNPPPGTFPGDLTTGAAGNLITVQTVSSTSFTSSGSDTVRTCHGDSGGPATRFSAGNFIAVGTIRGILTDLRSSVCSISSDTLTYTRTSDKTNWMLGPLQEAYGKPFTCGGVPTPCKCFGSGASAYYRCW